MDSYSLALGILAVSSVLYAGFLLWIDHGLAEYFKREEELKFKKYSIEESEEADEEEI